MALKDQYTWKDFLAQNPDLKKKGIKRTSAEGKKAFEAAFKATIKNYLKERETRATKFIDKMTETKKALVAELKKVDGKKWVLKAKAFNQKIGRYDAALARFEKLIARTKESAKSF